MQQLLKRGGRANARRPSAWRFGWLGIMALLLASCANTSSSLTTVTTPSTIPGTISEFTVPTAGGSPEAITAGPDGNIWFSEENRSKIGFINPMTFAFTEYNLPSPNNAMNTVSYGITAGPDKNVWFTEWNQGKIGFVTSQGNFTEYALANVAARPFGIVAGPDGNLWFTEAAGGMIGRITTKGSITEYPLPAQSVPQEITVGPDGALWFTDVGRNSIGRITTDGTVSEYHLPASVNSLFGITKGPDGRLWFTANGQAGSILPDGTGIALYPFATGLAGGRGIALGPDGNVWCAEFNGNAIVNFAPNGTRTEYPLPNDASRPSQIVTGADGDIWFTEVSSNRLGRIIPPK
jgi:streptogramin lyase